MLIAQDLILFVSDADCTGLEFGYSSGLIPLMPVWLRFEVLWRFWFIETYLLSPRRSFWSFYQVRDPSLLCIPISDMKTYIWCNMSCNVWLCMNEMLVHWFHFYVFSFNQICHLFAHAYFTGLLVQSLSPLAWEIFLSRYLPIASYLIFRSWKRDILVQTFKCETHDFSFLRFGLYHSRVVNKFHMNNKNY